MVPFSLAQLAKEEEIRKKQPKFRPIPKPAKKEPIPKPAKKEKLPSYAKKNIADAAKWLLRVEENRQRLLRADEDRLLRADEDRQPPSEPITKPYVNPDFAAKEKFKQEDSTKKQLGGFNPGTKLYSSQRTELGPEDSLKITRNNPMGLIKPLEPNILDAAADERQKELAKQRKGQKWVLLQRR